ncbi:MAG TPA: LysE family translocator, partial [Solirubrobacteraceae bacterium]|nr:LysE family translocator [Solirubrobacteraceae bacterium]
VWGTATVVGLTGLLTASDAAFTAVRLAGAAYLVVLGVQALRAAAAPIDPSGTQLAGARVDGPRRAFARGLASDLANVKVGLFWTAVAPQAVAADAGPLLPAAMVATMASIVLVWLTGYALLAARVAPKLTGPRAGRGLNATAGVAFLALGLSLAVT